MRINISLGVFGNIFQFYNTRIFNFNLPAHLVTLEGCILSPCTDPNPAYSLNTLFKGKKGP